MSNENEKIEEPKLIVDEQKDGSVTVEGIDLPPNDDQEASEGDSSEQMAAGGSVPEDGGVDHPDDTEAIRSARRDKRKAKMSDSSSFRGRIRIFWLVCRL